SVSSAARTKPEPSNSWWRAGSVSTPKMSFEGASIVRVTVRWVCSVFIPAPCRGSSAMSRRVDRAVELPAHRGAGTPWEQPGTARGANGRIPSAPRAVPRASSGVLGGAHRALRGLLLRAGGTELRHAVDEPAHHVVREGGAGQDPPGLLAAAHEHHRDGAQQRRLGPADAEHARVQVQRDAL